MSFNTGSIAGLCGEFQKYGAEEGSYNRPDAKALAPDINEVKAITLAKQAAGAEDATLADALLAADKQCSEIALRLAVLDAQCSSYSGHNLVESAFRAELAKSDPMLVAACAEEMTTRAYLNGFMQRNHIKDPASYPADRLYHFSFLILFVVIETGVNAFFYEGATGLLGGALIALSISVVNMGAAALLGALFRYVNLPATKQKMLGYGSLIGFIVSASVMNLIFATFRVQYQLLQNRVIDANLPEPGTLQLVGSLKVAVTDALGIFLLQLPAVDFMSFMLFFVGFGCSILAFWKGYTFDDKYPGYGVYDRLHKHTENAFVEAKQRIYQDAVSSVTRTAQEVEGMRSNIIAQQHYASTLKVQVLAAQAALASTLKTIQAELNLLLDTYRSANRATRATTEPAYFHEPVYITCDGSAQLQPLLEKIDQVSLTAMTLAQTHGAELGNRLTQIQQQTHMLIEDTFQKNLAGIKLRAEALISSRPRA